MIPAVEPILLRLSPLAQPAVLKATQTPSWVNVRRALAALAAEPQAPELTIHILCSFNLEPILPALQLGLSCIPCRPKIQLAPLDTIEQQILDPNSPVYRERNLATIILWRPEELMADLLFPRSAAKQDSFGARAEEIVARIKNLVQVYLANSPSPLFVATVPLLGRTGGAILDSQLADGLAATIQTVNASIHRLGLTESRVRIFDAHRWAAMEGRSVYDFQMDFLARQPLTVEGAVSFGFFLARNIRPLLIPPRKVLAVDLDNTLWGGIVGEDSLSQLKLGGDFPGNVYLRIQKQVLDLKRHGVLLVLLSKNNEADAHRGMTELPNMSLSWDDFICRKVNFKHKYENLREAASDLGLGLDSFAMLDDSDYEREQVRQFIPEVQILNERADALHILESLLQTDAFDTHHVSEEDLSRHEDYQLRSARNAPPQSNLEDFLSSLELRAKVEPVGNGNIDRVVQMLGKTNQFNLTTRRHSLEEISRMVAHEGAICLSLRLIDKFGDQGIVGALLAVPNPADGSLAIDSFLVSCRALGRGVEEVLWAETATRAAASGVKRISAEYLPTAKNGLAAQIYEHLGLKCVEETAAGKKYALEPVKPISNPPWIVVERFNQ